MHHRTPLFALLPLAALASAGCAPDAADTGDLFAVGEVYDCASHLSAYPPSSPHPSAVRVDLTLPADAPPLDAVSVEIQPQPGHAALPAHLPSFSLAQELGDGTIAILATAHDRSATVEDYEEPHTLTLVVPRIARPPLLALSYAEQGKGAVSYGRMLGWRCVAGLPADAPAP